MSLTDAAIQKIVDISRPEQMEIGGRAYTTKEVHAVLSPVPASIYIETLTGLVDYVRSDEWRKDNAEATGAFIQVKDPANVALVSTLFGTFRQRITYVVCQFKSIKAFPFERYIGHEEFIVGLQSLFVPDETVKKVLRLVGNIKDKAVARFSDDGVTQSVKVRKGIAFVDDQEIENPIRLQPYRTFMEIEQPASDFILRLRQNNEALPSVALHEADGGAWKLEATIHIQAYLKEHLPDMQVIA